MGKGRIKRYLNTYAGPPTRSLVDNLPSVTKEFPLSSSGYFGVKGSTGKVRRIKSDNPNKTACRFFEQIAQGAGEGKDLGDGKGIRVVLTDGTTLVYREVSSSDGSPAVDINLVHRIGSVVRSQKIHFEKTR